MKSFVLVSEKSWHDSLFSKLQHALPGTWFRISERNQFTVELLERIRPDKVFIPHWSYLIPPEIFNRFECVVFHMTDLPFGRGGSPLQNLIVRGLAETKLSAIRVTAGLDEGDVYLKQTLSLEGTAREIFIRAAGVMEEMIIDIVRRNIVPVPQVGEPVIFKRRRPEDGNIASLTTVTAVYDYIRMLDCEGYPPAFLEIGDIRLEFTKPVLNSDQTLEAHVRILKK